MSQFNNNKEEQQTVSSFRGDFRKPRGEYNRDSRNYSTQRYNNRNPRRFNDNRGGNGQRNFQRRPGYHNNERRGNNRRFNNSNWRGSNNKRPSNNRKRVVKDKDGWSTVQGSSNSRFNNVKTNYAPMKPKKDDNKFNLLEQTIIKKEVKDIPKVVKKKPVLQGAWGKGISNAVKEDVKFEKKVVEEKKDDGMLTLSNDLTQVQDDAKKNSAYLFKPLGKSVNWGDMQYDEDEQYQDDYYSEDDYQMNCNESVSSDGSGEYDEYDDYQY